MRTRSPLRHVLLAFVGVWISLGLGAWRPARAQSGPSAQIVVTAQVVAEPLWVESQRNFGFDVVYPGIAVTVDVGGAGSGRWRVTGQSGAEVRLTFDLPSQLVAGSLALPISFGSTSAAHNVLNAARSGTLFDPRVGTLARLSDDPETPELYVWIGGSVSPPIDQPSGTYSGIVTLTVSYTGN